jgi:hypothetical protein
MTRIAACDCGRLRATCEGEPVRVSVCHCLECQKRTGSVFGVSARYPKEKVKAEGPSRQYTRIADSGFKVTFDFCPSCGTTVHWHRGREGWGPSDSEGLCVLGHAPIPAFPRASHGGRGTSYENAVFGRCSISQSRVMSTNSL